MISLGIRYWNGFLIRCYFCSDVLVWNVLKFTCNLESRVRRPSGDEEQIQNGAQLLVTESDDDVPTHDP